MSYPIRDLAGDLNLSSQLLSNHLHTLTGLGALWFERQPRHDGEYGILIAALEEDRGKYM